MIKHTIVIVFGNNKARERWFAMASIAPTRAISVTRNPPVIGVGDMDIRGLVICNHMDYEVMRGLRLSAIIEDISFAPGHLGLHDWDDFKRLILR